MVSLKNGSHPSLILGILGLSNIVHGPPTENDGIGVSLINRNSEGYPTSHSALGSILALTLRVPRDSLTIRALAYMLKFIWNVKVPFQTNRFKDATFRQATGFLKCCNCNWEVLDDTPIQVSKEALETWSLPQWAIFGRLLLGVFSYNVINKIVSVLGIPINAL